MSEIKSGNSYRFLSYSDGKYLNILTSTTPANNKNVTTYSLNSSDMCQVWKCVSHSNGSVSGMLMKSERDNAFSLDRYRGSSNYDNADVYATATTTADLKDQLVTFVSATQGYYRIKLAYTDLYLTVTSTNTTGGHDVRWKALTGDTDQLWLPQLYYDASPIPSAPNNILNKTFVLQAKDTSFNLNIYGTETVANERNVNIYSADDVQAQRWIVKQTSAGPKLFTKLNEDFALNIRTTDNERTMYIAQGNDKDSVLEFISAGESMCYKIRTYNHDKYLSISGDVKSGADVIWSSSDKATVWKFVDENTAFPSAPSAPDSIVGKIFFIKNITTRCNLNVHGVDTVSNGRNVNNYAKENCLAQKWRVVNTPKGPKILTEINNNFALNIVSDEDPNCTMYNKYANNNDTVLEFEPYIDETYSAKDKVYRIKMFHHNRYLASTGLGSGYNVRWSELKTGYCLWQFVEESDMFTSADNAPSSIVNRTFFLQNVNTGLFLNVHGVDSVSNTRNVNVYSKENCLAQKWVVKNTSSGPKLFTKIDENFALNIYTTDNNCTMYTAQGNDNDSVLDFIPYVNGDTTASENIYRIKMHNHGRFLGAGGTNIGANAYWTSVDTEPYVMWKFIPENDMTFEDTDVDKNADSPLVTKFIPADTSNYTPCSSGRTISSITIHHMAGNMSIDALGAMWQNPNRNASSHYGVRGTQVGQYVKESNIAWTNRHSSNSYCVTIETANCSGAPDWKVADDTYYTLVRLVADIARRNNLGKLEVGKTLTYHSFFSATECPGPYLLDRIQDIADRANAINAGKNVYLRKHNSSYFIGVNSDNKIIPVKKDNAHPWKLVDNDGKILIYDATDNTKILNVDSDGITPKLVSVNSKNADVFGEYNNENLVIKAVKQSTSRAISKTNTSITLFLSFFSKMLSLLFKNLDMQLYDVEESPTEESHGYLKSNLPDDMIDGFCYTIKHSNGNYLTYENGNVTIKSKFSNQDEREKQIWKICSGSVGYTISPISNINMCIHIDEGDNISVKPIGSPNNEGDMTIIKNADSSCTITSCRYIRDLGVQNDILSVNRLLLTSSWFFEEPEPYFVDDQLKFYYNPQKSNNKRHVVIPNYAYTDANGNKIYTTKIPGYDNVTFKYTDSNYWYAFENETDINTNAKDSRSVYGYSAITPEGKDANYAIADKMGDTYYWVAVGPRVINPNFPPNRVPMGKDNEYPMFGQGTLDAVLNKNGIEYYLRCVVGDIKAHTWNNGIIQTDYSYELSNINLPPEELKSHKHSKYNVQSVDGNEWNGQSCIEFIIKPNENPEGILKMYAIKEILFYDNPIS